MAFTDCSRGSISVQSWKRKFPMNELSNEVNYGEMKAELQAFREKLEDLES